MRLMVAFLDLVQGDIKDKRRVMFVKVLIYQRLNLKGFNEISGDLFTTIKKVPKLEI